MCKETDEKDAATSRDAEMSDWPLFKSVVPEILCAQKSLLKLLKNAPYWGSLRPGQSSGVCICASPPRASDDILQIPSWEMWLFMAFKNG